jgi:hypothetical protein
MTGIAPIRVTPWPEDAATTRAVAVVSKTLRQKREEAAALIRLVEQAVPTDGKGQLVNYRG